MNVNVLGWYNHGNTGDEAYKAAFPLLFPEHQLEFVEKITPEDKPDVMILGGGDVFYPSFTKYFELLSPNIPKITASVSLTDNSDFASLAEFSKVIVRDYRSLALAHEHNIEAIYRPDFTFMLTPNADEGREWLSKRFEDEDHELYEKVVVCVISNYLAHAKLDMLARDLTAFLALSQDIAKIADDTNASFVFLPFSTKAPWDDLVSNAWVADRCKYYSKNLVIRERLDVQTTLNIMAASHACVSSRLHSSIFSTIAGIRFIDITHHTKNLGFVETIDKIEWSMPFWEFSVRDYRRTLHDFLSQPQKDNSLQNFTRLAKEQLSATSILR